MMSSCSGAPFTTIYHAHYSFIGIIHSTVLNFSRVALKQNSQSYSKEPVAMMLWYSSTTPRGGPRRVRV